VRKSNGFIYAAKMTNSLAKEISESNWDVQLTPQLGTLRKLFKHMVRVRDVYCDGLKTGDIYFPGKRTSGENSLVHELERSMKQLEVEFKQTKFKSIRMGTEHLTIMDLLSTAIQHEGIHQGQYFVALKQSGFKLPKQWEEDWQR
jgi:uncharacterized damage-inducible protein DinB